jgi:hypothetical protein
MSANTSSTSGEWMWKSNLNPFSWKVEDEWRNYSEEQNDIIERAYQDNEDGVHLKNYYIDFERSEQIASNDSSKRRPIKRLVQNKGNTNLEVSKPTDEDS